MLQPLLFAFTSFFACPSHRPAFKSVETLSDLLIRDVVKDVIDFNSESSQVYYCLGAKCLNVYISFRNVLLQELSNCHSKLLVVA